jgi:hypothetical protein
MFGAMGVQLALGLVSSYVAGNIVAVTLLAT